MSELDIGANRAATKYSAKEMVLRVLWGVGKILFKLTPRPCFGLRRILLKAFGAQLGANVNIYPSSLVYFPWNLVVEDDASIGEWALIYNLGPIRIGRSSTISQRVHLCAGTHDYRDTTMPLMKPPIVVGDRVWVCADAFVGPSVTIGDNAIIAAASVVVRDVESGVIVGGNPAKFIKQRDE